MRPALANIITARVPEADLLIDYMTVRPQGNRAFLISDTIRRLKYADLWARKDVLWMPAAHDAQAGRLNWKDPSRFALTEVNSPTFTADRGYAGNGTTSYLNTGFTPSTNGVNVTLNGASLGTYVNAGTDSNNSLASTIGSHSDDGNGHFWLLPRNAGTNLAGRVNTGAGSTVESAVTTAYGFSVLNRSAASVTEWYKNGQRGTIGAFGATALSSNQMAICATRNSSTTVNNPSNLRVAFAFAGGSLSAAQQAAFFRITQDFLASIGAAI